MEFDASALVALDLSLTDVLAHKELLNMVYVVKDRDVVKYVGMTVVESVATRIAKHITASTKSPPSSSIGHLISDSHPRYFDWRVQVLTQQECRRMVRKNLNSLKEAERAVYDFYLAKQGAIPGNAKRP